MTSVYVSPQPAVGHVYVEVDASAEGATCCQLTRIHADDTEHVVRPSVWLCADLGEWQKLSGGRAVYWDTEAPLDSPFRYRIDVDVDEDPAETDAVTLESGGVLWLRDPLRPCNDVSVGLCWPPRPDCVAGDDVFFAGLDAENYAAQGSMFVPNDGAAPIAVVRRRRTADTSVIVVSRTFVARDKLLQLLAPGNVLQMAGGATWGLPDRYMDVQDAAVNRLSLDHRYEPRAFQLPYVTEDRPLGPGYGVCGSRIADLCSGGFDSWQDMTDAGLSWIEVLAGAAGATPPDVYGRSYADVLADFADYSAVLADGTYDDVAAGS